MEKTDLLNIDPKKYLMVSEEEILHWFDLCDAAWVHDGDPKKPHAELTSGKCSNGFFDCLRVLRYPNLTEILARQLVTLLANRIDKPDWVIGSAYAAITFSYEVAKAFGAMHWFVEKDPADAKKMTWARMQLPFSAKVMQIEELITTSGTMMEVRRAVEEGNTEPVKFLPVVGALVHRPPKLPADYGDREVVALVEKEIWAVDPSECSLCQAGSIRYRPKTHWAELTGKK